GGQALYAGLWRRIRSPETRQHHEPDWRADRSRTARNSRSEQTESDRARRFAFLQIARQYSAGARVAGVFGAECFRQSALQLSSDRVRRKNARYQYVHGRPLRGFGATDRAGDAADDGALPLCLPQGSGLQSKNPERGSAALQPAHAGFTVWSDVVPRFARQSRRGVEGEFQQRRLQRRGYQGWFERQLPAILLSNLHVLPNQTEIQFCAFHAIGLPGALWRHGILDLPTSRARAVHSRYCAFGPDSDDHSAPRAIFCGWRNVPARLCAQPSRTARCLHRFPDRWSGYAGAQPGISLSDALTVYRDISGRRYLL